MCNWYIFDYVWIMFTQGINQGVQLSTLFTQCHREKLIHSFIQNYITIERLKRNIRVFPTGRNVCGECPPLAKSLLIPPTPPPPPPPPPPPTKANSLTLNNNFQVITQGHTGHANLGFN